MRINSKRWIQVQQTFDRIHALLWGESRRVTSTGRVTLSESRIDNLNRLGDTQDYSKFGWRGLE